MFSKIGEGGLGLGDCGYEVVGTVADYLRKVKESPAPRAVPDHVPPVYANTPVLASLREMFPAVGQVKTIREAFAPNSPYTGLAAAL